MVGDCAPIIAALMKRLEVTQTQLAEAAGVSQAQVSRWVNGRQGPSASSALALADLMEEGERDEFLAALRNGKE